MATENNNVLVSPKAGGTESNFRQVTLDGVFNIWKYLPHSNELGRGAVTSVNKIIKAVEKVTNTPVLQLVTVNADGKPTDNQQLYIGLLSEEVRTFKKGSYPITFVPADKASKPYSMVTINKMLEEHRRLMDTFPGSVSIEERKKIEAYRKLHQDAIKYIRAQL